MNRVYITQGEHHAGDHPELVISTLLGSCVACCLWDPEAQVGGMNHLLLPARGNGKTFCNSIGVNAMELLITEITKLGTCRSRLRAKVFGGARMISGSSDIGESNARFVLSFLEENGIACDRYCIGGVFARMLKFWPTTGRVLQKKPRAG